MRCNNCGFINQEINKFCSECGEKLIIASENKLVETKSNLRPEKSAILENEETPNINPSINNIDVVTKKEGASKIFRKKYLAIFIIIIIIVIGFLFFKDYVPYMIANNYLSTRQYEKASLKFSQLGNYLNSANLVSESKYRWGLSSIQAKDYLKAIDLFKSIISYKDSRNYLMDVKYLYAVSVFEENKYKDAMALFKELSSYKDSAEKMKESQYMLASEFFSKNDYQNASDIFKELGNYKDSVEQKRESDYQIAKGLISGGDFYGAVNALLTISGYKDSEDLLIESRYGLAKYYIDQKDFIQAEGLLETILDYEDSSDLLFQTRYELAKQKYYSGDFMDSKRYFELVKNSKDANQFLSKIDQIIKFQGNWLFTNKALLDRKYLFQIEGWKGEFYDLGIHPYKPEKFEITEYDILKNKSFQFNRNDPPILEYFTVSIGTSDTMNVHYIMTGTNGYVNADYFSKGYRTNQHITGTVRTPIPPKPRKPDPQIGMTADEVRNSSWGNPREINRTTTAYGVSEQWVYSDYRYIYLDDGIVTAIQDSQ
jgi:hypothetical protein